MRIFYQKLIPIFITLSFFTTAFGQKIGDTLTLSSQLLKEGVRLHDEKKYDEALEKYREISPYDTNYALTLYEIGLSEFTNKNYTKAVSALKEGIRKFDKLKLDNTLLLAKSYSEINKDSAHYYYRTCKKTFPNSYRPYNDEAVLYRKEENWESQLLQLDSAKLKNIYAIAPHVNYSSLAYSAGQPSLGLLALHFASIINNNTIIQSQTYQLLVKMADDNFETEFTAPEGFIKNCESMAEINELVKAKVALTPKYKIKTKIDERYIRQMQLILERLDKIPTIEENPNAHFYLNFYKQVWEKGYFEAAILSGLSALRSAANVESAYRKKQVVITEFEKWTFDYLTKLRDSSLSELLSISNDTRFIFHNNGELSSFGKVNTDKMKFGEWSFFDESGNFTTKGSFNDASEQTGDWKSYYPNGKLAREENFIPAKKVREYTTYYENGSPSFKGKKLDGRADGEITEFHRSGAIKRKYTLEKGEVIGVFRGYTFSGALAFELFYDGTGVYKTYFENGKLKLEGTRINNKFQGVLKAIT